MKLAEAKRRITPGIKITAENHIRPEASGVRTVTRVQGNGFWFLLASDGPGSTRECWLAWPKAALVVDLGPDSLQIVDAGRPFVTLSLTPEKEGDAMANRKSTPPASPQTPATFLDPVFGASQDVPASPSPAPPSAPRWTLAPGRWICYDGKPLVALTLYQEKETGARNCQPAEADDLAHLLVALLEAGQEDLPVGAPHEFPLSPDVAETARLITPTTLPGEGVARG